MLVVSLYFSALQTLALEIWLKFTSVPTALPMVSWWCCLWFVWPRQLHHLLLQMFTDCECKHFLQLIKVVPWVLFPLCLELSWAKVFFYKKSEKNTPRAVATPMTTLFSSGERCWMGECVFQLVTTEELLSWCRTGMEHDRGEGLVITLFLCLPFTEGILYRKQTSCMTDHLVRLSPHVSAVWM